MRASARDNPLLHDLADFSAGVLLDCAFLRVQPVDDWGALVGDVLHAVVDVEGSPPARLMLSAPQELTLRFACDSLGGSPSELELLAHSGGALAELANALAFALVDRYLDEAHYIGLPSLHRGLPAPAPEPEARTYAATLLVDAQSPLRVTWCIKPRRECRLG
jgi:hypothetical protein